MILQTDEELTNIKTVTVKLKGEGDVHWTERVSCTSYETRVSISEHMTILMYFVLIYKSMFNYSQKSRTNDGKTEYYTEHYRNSEVYIK